MTVLMQSGGIGAHVGMLMSMHGAGSTGASHAFRMYGAAVEEEFEELDGDAGGRGTGRGRGVAWPAPRSALAAARA